MRFAVAALAALLCASTTLPSSAQEAVVVVATRTIYPGETVPADALEEITLRAGATPSLPWRSASRNWKARSRAGPSCQALHPAGGRPRALSRRSRQAGSGLSP